MANNQALRFSADDRDFVGEDRIELTSVGVDIGSSTSHLVFSRLVLERQGQRYATVERSVLHESPILLTPYANPTTIDGQTLERFIAQAYEAAGFLREEIDSGAVILTGTALLKENSRMVADIFAEEAGRFVAVSAGDRLEASLAAFGSGAVAASTRLGGVVLNVDIGGGTTKLALCQDGVVCEVAAIDIGARLFAVDDQGIATRVEETGRDIARRLGVEVEVGSRLDEGVLRRLTGYMADRLIEIIGRGPLDSETAALFRTPPLEFAGELAGVLFSGGVSEFVYQREGDTFGDLGPMLAEDIRSRLPGLGLQLLEPAAGIRATVIGASQYTVQISGNTIFISSPEAVPVRNLPVARPILPLERQDLSAADIERAVRAAIDRLDLHPSDRCVALALEWQGSATYGRLSAISQGVIAAEQAQLAAGQPIVLVCDSDVGGLIGLHIREESGISNGIISIDGVELREFDFIDIGALLPATGAAPVVIKSLVFPDSAAHPG